MAAASEFGIKLTKPNGKNKTKSELCKDLERLAPSFSVPRAQSPQPSSQSNPKPQRLIALKNPKCELNLRKDVVEMAKFFGISETKPGGKKKTKSELCKELENFKPKMRTPSPVRANHSAPGRCPTPPLSVTAEGIVPAAIVYSLTNIPRDMSVEEVLKNVKKPKLRHLADEYKIRGKSLTKEILLKKIVEKATEDLISQTCLRQVQSGSISETAKSEKREAERPHMKSCKVKEDEVRDEVRDEEIGAVGGNEEIGAVGGNEEIGAVSGEHTGDRQTIIRNALKTALDDASEAALRVEKARQDEIDRMERQSRYDLKIENRRASQSQRRPREEAEIVDDVRTGAISKAIGPRVVEQREQARERPRRQIKGEKDIENLLREITKTEESISNITNIQKHVFKCLGLLN